MSEQPEERYGEKYEKEEEKSEKEYGKEEKGNWEEKWHRDPLSAARWAIILIWAGIALLANQLPFMAKIDWLDGWALAFAGAGVIILMEAVVRVLVPAYRRPISGTLVLAAVFLGIGLGGLFGWEVTGAFILIAIGTGMLLRSFMRRK
ncbi:MAG: hypothetical protein JXA14_03010 [Anaerolineae bacterium]|nr:hypothetical protein [Anaerolineae bacterium]